MASVLKKTTMQWAVLVGKLFLGVALLIGLLVWNDNAQRLTALARTIGAKDLLGLFLVGLALNWVSCLKWRLFLKERGVEVSLGRLLNLYLVGKFFSNFMPTMVGGDLARTYLLGRQIHSQSQSFASVFLERFTGLIALILLAIFFSAVNPRLLREPKIGIAVLFFSIAFLLLSVLLLNQGVLGWAAVKLGSRRFIAVPLEKMRKVQQDILYFKGKYKLLSTAMLYSFAFHIMTSINVYLCCVAIDVFPSFLDIAVITPVILLLNILPVSPNNIGWWEWTFSFLLVEAGTGPAEGLAVALILRAMTLLFSLVGGALFLFEKAGKKQKSAKDCHEADF